MQDVCIGLVFMLAMTSDLIRSRVVKYTALITTGEKTADYTEEQIDLVNTDSN